MTTALVKNVDVRNFIVRLMVRAGTNQTEATDLAKVLVDADYRLVIFFVKIFIFRVPIDKSFKLYILLTDLAFH